MRINNWKRKAFLWGILIAGSAIEAMMVIPDLQRRHYRHAAVMFFLSIAAFWLGFRSREIEKGQ